MIFPLQEAKLPDRASKSLWLRRHRAGPPLGRYNFFRRKIHATQQEALELI